MSSASHAHIPLQQLLQDWLGEADAATREAIDEHLMACDTCGAAFDELVALGRGVRDAMRAGLVSAVTSAAFVERLAAQGWRVREYRVPRAGGVNCTLAPDDDLLLARLEVPLAGVQRLAAVQEHTLEPGVQRRREDIPFDAASGEVLFMTSAARARALPANTMWITLLARDDSGTRELGRYEFRHAPWPTDA